MKDVSEGEELKTTVTDSGSQDWRRCCVNQCEMGSVNLGTAPIISLNSHHLIAGPLVSNLAFGFQ